MQILTSSKTIIHLFIFLTMIFSTANAQKKATEDQQANELAKKLANPVSNLISVPFQNNFDYNFGELGGYRYTLNFQPVIPMKLGKSLSMINRFIVPLINQNNVTGSSVMQTGLGNTLYSAFFSPKTGKILFGVGPEIGFPATDKFLGAENWLIGPTLVVLAQPGPWSIGVLSNNLWAVNVDSSKSNVNNLYLQPFISYRFDGAFTIGISSEDTYDWLNKRLNSGMIALNLSQILKIGGKLPASIEVTPKYFFASKQVISPDWGIRAALTLLFPK
ncbi:MAG: transporter [Ignavibacteria bacterium]